VLLHYWQIIWKELRIPLMAQDDKADMYRQIAHQTGAKPAKTLALMGALTMIEKIGIRAFRSLMEEQSGNRSWQRMKKEIDSLSFSNKEKFSALANIGKAIEAFQPLKLRKFEV
jgi:hypothetical protein